MLRPQNSLRRIEIKYSVFFFSRNVPPRKVLSMELVPLNRFWLFFAPLVVYLAILSCWEGPIPYLELFWMGPFEKKNTLYVYKYKGFGISGEKSGCNNHQNLVFVTLLTSSKRTSENIFCRTQKTYPTDRWQNKPLIPARIDIIVFKQSMTTSIVLATLTTSMILITKNDDQNLFDTNNC